MKAVCREPTNSKEAKAKSANADKARQSEGSTGRDTCQGQHDTNWLSKRV